MSEQDKTTAEVIHAPGEDWLNGRQGTCGACGKEDELYWNPLEGHVQCHACGYVNPEATRDTILYLLEQRGADSDVIEQYQDDLEKAYEEIANLRESEKEAEDAAREKIEKLEADLKEARAKSKTAKVEADPEPVKVAKKE